MSFKTVTGKCVIWILSVMFFVSCAAPNQSLMTRSTNSKKILTDDNYFYHEGESYKYNDTGAAKLEVLTENMPEAGFEI